LIQYIRAAQAWFNPHEKGSRLLSQGESLDSEQRHIFILTEIQQIQQAESPPSTCPGP
jgi:hypothetical protein